MAKCLLDRGIKSALPSIEAHCQPFNSAATALIKRKPQHHYQFNKQTSIKPVVPAVDFLPINPFRSLQDGVCESVTFEGTDPFVPMSLFYPSSQESAELAKSLETPSFHFLHQPKPSGRLNECSVVPQFCDTTEQFGVEIKLEEGSHCYGGGEQARSLCLNGTQFITWNSDVPNYTKATKSLYQTHPFIQVLRKDGSGYGVIANTTYPLFFEMTDNHLKIVSHTQLAVPVPFSLLIFEGKTPQEITITLAKLTGFMALPPKWSLGYHQCRWSYYPDTRALEVARDFRKHKIPCDVIWFDIHYMNDYRIFTFDPQTFSNPKQLNDDLHNDGFHTVWMIDPGVKKEETYFVHDQCVEKDLAVWHCEPGKEQTDQKIFNGDVWPGSCVFPDFTMEETRNWWAGLYKDFLAHGIDGVWNDMNEPAVFRVPELTMSRDAWHRGYGGGTHERFHNVYGQLMMKASRQGILQANPEKRPFLLSRSNFLGGQQYGATWTGDNVSDWTHLGLSIPMVLNLGLSGQPFSGPDIGGFMSNADSHLFSRWMGFGALLPFARGHTTEESPDHEPWSFGEKCTNTSRVAIERRYMLLPYFYTLFHVASKIGLPVARPLFYEDPCDQALRKEDRAFMIGDSILVVADVLPHGEEHETPVAIPRNHNWYPLVLDDYHDDEDLPTMLIKEGSVVVTQEPELYVGEKSNPKLIIFVALDKDGFATGQLYQDAGDGYDFVNGGYRLTRFTAQMTGNLFTLDLDEEGEFHRVSSSMELNILYQDKKIKQEVSLTDGQKSIHVNVINL